MNIQDYFHGINTQSQKIFLDTITEIELFGTAHHLSAGIYEFSEKLFDNNEKEMLSTVSAQLESATLNCALGLYRQAFSSLRLAFEMGLGVVYFSINKMEHFEWIDGKSDIVWSRLIDTNNGVLSFRFADAFCPELRADAVEFNDKAKSVYRALSEFVHGNSETWQKSGIQLNYNKDLIIQYFEKFKEVVNIILFVLSCRYFRSISSSEWETMEFIAQNFNHISSIRILFGGPKE